MCKMIRVLPPNFELKNRIKYTAAYLRCNSASSAANFNFLSGKIAKSRPELKKIIDCA